ncbi:hypothetical protein KQX54_011833 [Cotesia glomerata]|uniref:MULE transposase domain-containing protein n=1 Tax=Cotesia glomerata TaxID=32391 RepID=A0AAV7I941_COTGL|nr:hypothetical protein KQX54_011833 [Cotesia glomerata]
MKLDLQHAVRSSMDDFRVIYDRIALLHPNVASFVTFKSMKTSMLRWRQKIRPSKVTSLNEYLRVINLDKWIDFRKYSFGTITVNPIVMNNETIAVILGDIQFLALLNNIQELHIDATFEVCPRNISNYIQLLTIMATVSDTALPITWVIMTSKTTAAYTAVLNHFSQVFAPHINPSSVSVDFEE